jgi:hypothetical protein
MSNGSVRFRTPRLWAPLGSKLTMEHWHVQSAVLSSAKVRVVNFTAASEFTYQSTQAVRAPWRRGRRTPAKVGLASLSSPAATYRP